MKKIIISFVLTFALASCASQDVDTVKVVDNQKVEKETKPKRDYRDCKKKSTGSRTRRC